MSVVVNSKNRKGTLLDKGCKVIVVIIETSVAPKNV